MQRGASRLLHDALVAGASAGLLVQVMVLRLNPEAELGAAELALWIVLWATWGAACAGLPLYGVLALVRRLRRRPSTHWRAPELQALIYFLAAAGSQANADIHREFLSGTGHRTLGQDAVTWLIGVVLALGGGVLIRRAGRPRALRMSFAALFLLLPLARLMSQPTPPPRTAESEPAVLGQPDRPLVVIGVEGLDLKVLLAHTDRARTPVLVELMETGAFGPLNPSRPYLRRSLWTSTATGAQPARHGVKARWAYRLPGLRRHAFRLLPWTPVGSRWMLPWALASREEAAPPTVPPLWDRLRASGVSTTVLGWPGLWAEGTVSADPPEPPPARALDPAFWTSLRAALAPFNKDGPPVLDALERDLARVAAGKAVLGRGSRSLFAYMESLSDVRRRFEPLDPGDTEQRAVLHLALEFLDEELGELLAEAPADALVALVSPYGLVPPNSWERLQRMLGARTSWRASPRSCPDGALLLRGEGVIPGHRFARPVLTDVAPTLCYLLGLPVAQAMDGRVILEAVEPSFLAATPLLVVS